MEIFIQYFMNIYNYLLLYKSYFLIIFFIILIFIIIILFSLCCYFLYKFFHIKIKKIYLDNYHGDSDKILKKYGNYPIKNVYIVKEKLNSSLHINIMDYFIKNFLKKNWNINNWSHISLIFDIKLDNNMISKIKINKNFFLNVTDNFNINGYEQTFLCKKIKNKKYTLNYVLNKTKNKINNKKYFNWNIYNHCQFFTKNVLQSMNILTKENLHYIDYLNSKKLAKEVKKKEEMYIYIFNIILNIITFFYKLIY